MCAIIKKLERPSQVMFLIEPERILKSDDVQDCKKNREKKVKETNFNQH